MGIIRLLNEFFDPFNLTGDDPYSGSIYQTMDERVRGAYAYYGYDLEELAARRAENPLTEQQVFDHLVDNKFVYVIDPATGEERSTYEWFVHRVSSPGVLSKVLDEFNEIDGSNRMNYEVNYLAALMAANQGQVLTARQRFRSDLVNYYGDDAVAIFEYLERIDETGFD